MKNVPEQSFVETGGIWCGRVKVITPEKTYMLESDGYQNYTYNFECKANALRVVAEGIEGDLQLRISGAKDRT